MDADFGMRVLVGCLRRFNTLAQYLPSWLRTAKELFAHVRHRIRRCLFHCGDSQDSCGCNKTPSSTRVAPGSSVVDCEHWPDGFMEFRTDVCSSTNIILLAGELTKLDLKPCQPVPPFISLWRKVRDIHFRSRRS